MGEVTKVELIIHLELADGEVVWSAESPDLPGFSAAAPSLADLRDRVWEAVTDLVAGPVELTERLAARNEGDTVRWAR